MKRLERNNLNTGKLNLSVTIGKSSAVGHKQIKEAAKQSGVLTIKQ